MGERPVSLADPPVMTRRGEQFVGGEDRGRIHAVFDVGPAVIMRPFHGGDPRLIRRIRVDFNGATKR